MHALLPLTLLLSALSVSASSVSHHKRTPMPFSKTGVLVPHGKRHAENGTLDTHHERRVPSPSSKGRRNNAAAERKDASRRSTASKDVVEELLGGVLGGRQLDVTVLLGQATSMLEGMQGCQDDFHSLLLTAQQKGPSYAKKGAFQNDVHAQLARYRKASADFPVLSKAFQSLKGQLDASGADADYGKENLDQCNQLEVVLGHASDSFKDMLADIDLFVYSAPVLGNTLGPLVYDLKCLVDSGLDTVTNTVDGLLNGNALLSDVSSRLGETVCQLLPTADGC